MKIFYNNEDSIRIDKHLASLNLESLHSRSIIDKLIKNDKVLVNGHIVKKSYLLIQDDIIEIELPKFEPPTIQGENIPLNIVFEDEYLLIINKQPGITVHPAPGHSKGTIVNALIHHYGEELSAVNPTRPGIVHRLDKSTSGLLIIAKNDLVHYKLPSIFKAREIEKHYKAICVGIPKELDGRIETFIDRSPNHRTKMTVSQSGKNAITNYSVKEQFDYFSLLDINIETGRTHQIRVHFSHINCPILGDPVYNTYKRTIQILPQEFHKKMKFLLTNHLTRQALHAYNLKFEHPMTKELIDVKADLPEDFNYTLEFLRKNFYSYVREI